MLVCSILCAFNVEQPRAYHDHDISQAIDVQLESAPVTVARIVRQHTEKERAQKTASRKRSRLNKDISLDRG